MSEINRILYARASDGEKESEQRIILSFLQFYKYLSMEDIADKTLSEIEGFGNLTHIPEISRTEDHISPQP